MNRFRAGLLSGIRRGGLALSWIDSVSCSDGGSVEPHERGAPDGLLGFLRSQFASGSSVEWVWVIMLKHHEDQ